MSTLLAIFPVTNDTSQVLGKFFDLVLYEVQLARTPNQTAYSTLYATHAQCTSDRTRSAQAESDCTNKIISKHAQKSAEILNEDQEHMKTTL